MNLPGILLKRIATNNSTVGIINKPVLLNYTAGPSGISEIAPAHMKN